eukprot:gene6003-10001_t
MGFWRTFSNLLYITNPVPKVVGEYVNDEEIAELPALPDLSQHFSKYNMFGSKKNTLDIRFPNNGADDTRKCQLNFGVWRQCLFEHSGDSFDEENPDAKICKKYHKLAMFTCPTFLYQRYMDQIENDRFLGVIGLNKYPKGTGFTALQLDEHNNVVKVFNVSKRSGKKYFVGDNISDL